MFIIPAGMWMGAPVTVRDWWLWNQLPVTFGNLVGGFLFVGLPMFWLRAPKRTAAASPAFAKVIEPHPAAQPEAIEA